MRTAMLLGLLWLAGCHAAPPPTVEADATGVPVPAAWPGEATAGELPEAWWTGFGEPALDAAVTRALEQNRDLQMAAARLDAAAALAVQAGASLEPTVDAGLNGSRTRRNFIGFPIPGGGSVLSTTTTSFGVSLDLGWELDLWGRVRAGEAVTLANAQAAAADLAALRLSVVAQTCKAFFAVAEAREQLALAETTLRSHRSSADFVRESYRRGVRPALDAHLAEATAQDGEAAVAQRRDLHDRAVRQLELLLGDYPAGRAAGGVALPAELPAVPAGLPSELLRRRPDLLAAERRLAAAGCRVDEARAALYPRLSLTASGGTSSRDPDDLIDPDFRVWSLGGNLLLPLFRGGALRAAVAQTEADQREALAGYGNALLRAFGEVETALAAEGRLAARERATLAAAAHSRDAAAAARTRYLGGIADILTLLESQRQEAQATSQAIALRRLRLENRIDLFLALGGGFRAPAEGEPQ